MESFYKAWLRKSDEENLEALQSTSAASTATVPNTPHKNQPSTSTQNESPSEMDILPSTSTEPTEESIGAQTNIPKEKQTYDTQTDIVFENEKLVMLVQKGTFQRQKRFRLQDHLFHIKIKLKNENDSIPFLTDILDFIEQGLLHIMDNIKKFYNAEDANLAFLTLFQKPMVTGLNSGIINILCLISHYSLLLLK